MAAEYPKASVAGDSAFASSLYGKLAAGSGNLFFSPYSIRIALAMTYSGARGNTAEEMQSALRFKLAQQQTPAALKALTDELIADAAKDNQKLNIANGLCLTHGDVSTDFKNLLNQQFDAEIFPGLLPEINAWVSRKTEGKIDVILRRLDPNSVCVLLNAIYFKGIWANRFEKSNTHDAPFTVSATARMTVPTMSQRNDFQILDWPDFQVLSMPYNGNHFSMVILLPRNVDGLAKVEKELAGLGLHSLLAQLDATPPQKVDLAMPKYSLSTGYDLVPACKALGIKDAFDPSQADFRGMGWPKGKLWISQIKHKAFLAVDEEGTEAAAATAVEMATRGAPPVPLVFHADHPFLMLIRHNQTGSILFLGRITDPSPTPAAST